MKRAEESDQVGNEVAPLEPTQRADSDGLHRRILCASRVDERRGVLGGRRPAVLEGQDRQTTRGLWRTLGLAPCTLEIDSAVVSERATAVPRRVTPAQLLASNGRRSLHMTATRIFRASAPSGPADTRSSRR